MGGAIVRGVQRPGTQAPAGNDGSGHELEITQAAHGLKTAHVASIIHIDTPS